MTLPRVWVSVRHYGRSSRDQARRPLWETRPLSSVDPFLGERQRLQSAEFLLAVDAEIIVEHSRRAIGIDRKMQRLMHEKVIPWSLADNSKVIYECIVRLAVLERILEALLGNTSRLILITGGLACTAYTLWLKMHYSTDVVTIDGK
jgi:hypothetical protein